MKKLVLTLLVLCSIGYSQDVTMDIDLKNDSTVTFAVSDIDKIVFENITGVDDRETLQQIVKAFKLRQNYPNPFNPTTTIAYQIPDAALVNVSIFDINGKLVKEVLNETQVPGQHTVTWDGKNSGNNRVASGVYIYAVKSGDLILSKQMILIK